MNSLACWTGALGMELLRYERVQADIATRLHGVGGDAATCIAIHENFVVLGTRRGQVRARVDIRRVCGAMRRSTRRVA